MDANRISHWVNMATHMLSLAETQGTSPHADICLNGACQYLRIARGETKAYFDDMCRRMDERQRTVVHKAASDDLRQFDIRIERIHMLRQAIRQGGSR